MLKKIVVRYPAGASGRFLACLVESLRNKDFEFTTDSNNGVHGFGPPIMPIGKISDYVYHTHDLMIKCMLDNIDTNLYIIQIIVNKGYEDLVLESFYYKCIKQFKEIGIVNDLTQKYLGWVKPEWSLKQVISKKLQPELKDLLLKELDSYQDNRLHVYHDRILNLHHGEIMSTTHLDDGDVIDKICNFLQWAYYSDRDRIVKILKDYRFKQMALYRYD
jgi:hypothetical protein